MKLTKSPRRVRKKWDRDYSQPQYKRVGRGDENAILETHCGKGEC